MVYGYWSIGCAFLAFVIVLRRFLEAPGTAVLSDPEYIAVAGLIVLSMFFIFIAVLMTVGRQDSSSR